MSTIEVNSCCPSYTLFKELIRLNKSLLFPDVYCLLSLENYFVEVSPACESNWGFNANELKGKLVKRFVDSTGDCLAPVFLKDAPEVSESFFLTKEGTAIPIQWIIKWNEEDGLFYCIAKNKEEKQLLANRLVQTEERLKRLLQMSKMGNWEKNFSTGEVYSSDEVFQIFGLSKNEQSGVEMEDFFRLVHAEDIERVLAFYQNLANQESIDIEHRLIRPDGRTVILHQVGQVKKDDAGKILLVSGTVQDITALREKEEEIRIANQRNEFMLNATNDVVWDLDMTNNSLWWNRNFKILFGCEPKETLECWLETLHPDDRKRIDAEMEIVIEKKAQAWSGEYRIKKDDGTYRYVFDRAFLIYDQNGKPLRMVGSILDITNQKKDAKVLEDLNRKLRQLSDYMRKLQEKENAHAASVLHEELAQQIVTVKLEVMQLSAVFGEENIAAKEKLEKIFKILNSSIVLVKNLSYDIYPEILTDLGIVDAIEWRSKNFSEENKIDVDFVADCNNLLLSKQMDIHLFRLYEECCRFLLINFKAKTIKIRLLKDEDRLSLSFNSPLLPPENKISVYTDQLDWLNITERVFLMEGQIQLRQQDQHTICIYFFLSCK